MIRPILDHQNLFGLISPACPRGDQDHRRVLPAVRSAGSWRTNGSRKRPNAINAKHSGVGLGRALPVREREGELFNGTLSVALRKNLRNFATSSAVLGGCRPRNRASQRSCRDGRKKIFADFARIAAWDDGDRLRNDHGSGERGTLRT